MIFHFVFYLFFSTDLVRSTRKHIDILQDPKQDEKNIKKVKNRQKTIQNTSQQENSDIST